MKRPEKTPADRHAAGKGAGFLRNIHFWVITLITAVLAVSYNLAHFAPPYWLARPEDPLGNYFAHEAFHRLFFIPVVYSGFIFGFRGALVTSLAFIAMISYPKIRFVDYEPLIGAASLSLIMFGAGMLAAALSKVRHDEKQAFAQLEKSRQDYVSRVLKAQEDERQRIARELHDDVLQSLLAAANQSQALVAGRYGPLSPEATARTKDLMDTILRTSQEVRRLSQDLRPSILDNMGLLPALRWLTDRLSRETSIHAGVIVNGTERKLSPEAEAGIFRIVQEALNNVRRHSSATETTVSLDFSPEGIQVTVRDNGKGFAPPDETYSLVASDKLGLDGMYQRARLLNASLNIQSEPGKGTTVSLEVRA